MPPKTKAKSKSPREVLAALRAQENADGVTRVGALDEFDFDYTGYSTQNIIIDYLTGVGGLPKGRIVDVYGEYSSGKTTVALQAMATAQQNIIATGDDEKFVMFLDYERTFAPDYARALGVDVAHPSFVYVKPKHLEHGANIFRQVLDAGGLSVAVFDSVASMVSERELESETGKAEVAQRAKALHQFLRQITGSLEQHGATAIFCNHTMEKVDTSPMGQRMAAQGIKRQTQPGGTALPFYASARIETKKIGQVKGAALDGLTGETADKTVLGQKVQVTVVKNKVAPAFGTAEVRLRQGRGFSQAWSVLTVLNNHGVLGRTQGYYNWPEDLLPAQLQGDGKYKVKGEEKQVRALESSPEWLALAEARAKKLLSDEDVKHVDGTKYDSDGVVIEDVKPQTEHPTGALTEHPTGALTDGTPLLLDDPDDD